LKYLAVEDVKKLGAEFEAGDGSAVLKLLGEFSGLKEQTHFHPFW
jgi:hypothetical protein